ncbi:MAG: aminoacyl-histidine dipeptidase [Clostridia bacterium BRH_c25]|nr:MAG: aminoacyl-histidine dipeptidase [Clostridia bacterium BRH_c25]
MDRLKNSKYSEVFRYFEEISAIPRGSGNEKQISDYMVRFAGKHGLEVIRDEALNVIIKKPASRGYENAPTVILQGHMDMVCEKNKETVHDFEKDPIKLRVVDDMIYAHGTTLGADNGIALAYALVLLASKNLPHPSLEVLFTSDEENTMSGAPALDAGKLKGKLMINLDSEEEGKFLVSSAGGLKAKMVIPIEWEKAPQKLAVYRLGIGGLKGGHSGMEIDKGRGNANKLMGRLLNHIRKECEIHIAEINGGLKSNAIPREAEVLLLTAAENRIKLEAVIKEQESAFKNELRAADPGICTKLEDTEEKVEKVFSKKTADRVISSMVLLPNGIQSMSMEIAGLVESSTNLGVVNSRDNEIWLTNEIRSSVRSLKRNVFNQVEALAALMGGSVKVESEYPEWEYNPGSKLKPLFIKVYKEKYQAEPEIVAIHAGLECGVFMSRIKDLDAISLGPDMYDVHTPDEHLSIPSTERVFELLLDALKEMKEI